jgi:hypothetical protein
MSDRIKCLYWDRYFKSFLKSTLLSTTRPQLGKNYTYIENYGAYSRIILWSTGSLRGIQLICPHNKLHKNLDLGSLSILIYISISSLHAMHGAYLIILLWSAGSLRGNQLIYPRNKIHQKSERSLSLIQNFPSKR